MLMRALDKIGSFFRLERDLLLLFAAGLAGVIALQLIQPLFPVYLQSLDASEIEISLVVSLSSVAGTFLMLPTGNIMNRVGGKRMFIAGFLLWGVSTFFIALANNWRTVAALYIFHGIAEAFVGPARMTLISSASTPATEATVFGLMSLDWSIGGTVAPPVSGYLAERIGWQVPLLAASAAFMIGIIPILKMEEGAPRQVHGRNPETSVTGIFETRSLAAFLYFMFGLLTNSAQSMVGTMLPLFLKNQLSLSTTIIGLFFTAANLIGILIQVPGGLLADRYGRKRLITLLLLPLPLVYGLWGIVDRWQAYLLIYVLSRGLISMMGPATLAIVSEVFLDEQKGSAFGIRMAGVRLGSAVGPLIGGYLYSTLGPVTPFTGAGVILLLSIPFIYLLK
jgi:MFS family permease